MELQAEMGVKLVSVFSLFMRNSVRVKSQRNGILLAGVHFSLLSKHNTVVSVSYNFNIIYYLRIFLKITFKSLDLHSYIFVLPPK